MNLILSPDGRYALDPEKICYIDNEAPHFEHYGFISFDNGTQIFFDKNDARWRKFVNALSANMKDGAESV